MLIVFAGLPAVGKSTIAREAARILRLPWLSVDPIEAALLRSGIDSQQPTGLAAYVVAQAVADEQLSLGQSIIVDAVNAVEEARSAWRRLATAQEVPLLIVECICSDVAIHRQRLEERSRNLTGMREPTWEDVERRRAEYAPWAEERLVLDTVEAPSHNVERVRRYIGAGS